MTTSKIKALFNFIEFLHSNIDNFNQYSNLINELELLDKERQKVTHKKTFIDKLKYDELQAEIEKKFKILQDNTANLIKDKAKELNVCNFDNEPNYSFNGIEAEIHQLKENFSKKDLSEIFIRKAQYIEYRNKTHKTFLSLAFFIDELDEITKSLFDYFKDTEQNEFEAFENKTIEVNSIEEAIQGFKQGQNKFIIPTPINETKARILKNLADKLFFQIDQIADFEFEGKIYPNVKQKNNDSILTPENWEQYKEAFFEQRMTNYKESYTISEKIKLELETVEKLPINKTDYKILIDRYRDYLVNKHKPQQLGAVRPKKSKKTLFEFIHNIEDKESFTNGLKDLFPTEIGKSIKAIIDILSNEQILIYGTKEFKQLFEELTNCFARDLGTYNSVQNVKIVDSETTSIINKKLNPLIIKHKTT